MLFAKPLRPPRLKGFHRPQNRSQESRAHRNQLLPAQLSRKDLVHVAPHPRFSRFNRADEWVLAAMEMLGRMFIFRRIATADVAAFQAQTQMHPRVSKFDALFANVLVGAGNRNLIQVGALAHVVSS